MDKGYRGKVLFGFEVTKLRRCKESVVQFSIEQIHILTRACHMKLKSLNAVLIVVLALAWIPSSAPAKSRATVIQQSIRAENPKKGKEWLVLPYAFSTDGMGTVFGVGGGAKGYGQDQLLVGATGFGGLEDTYGGVLGLWDYRLPWTERFFVSAVASYGHYPRQRAYFRLAYPADEPRRGGNDSDRDDYVVTPGNSNWADFKLEYVLPIGAARNRGMVSYSLKGGMLQGDGTGGTSWNPLTGGVTTLMLRQYNELQSFETEFGLFERTIHPVELGIGYNNTDYPNNPSTGSSQFFSVTRDFGWGDAAFPWTFWQFEASKYLSLGKSKWAKQRVLAFNAWTGDSPSWSESVTPSGDVVITNRPPHYDGATLGGFYRMRAYPTGRFNDRSVVYSTAEVRYTPFWNPIGNVSWLRWLQMDWWQFVGYIEGGRVADEYSFSELFSEWKVDVGLGIRAMMAGGVVRFDWAVSEEGSGMWLMFGQPF